MKSLKHIGIVSAMALVAALPERRLTKEFLESEIENVEFNRLSGTITHCAIHTKSGFTFTGESVCVDPNNFNEEIGKVIAYENAFEDMWLPYGFWLHKALAEHELAKQSVEMQTADNEPYELTGEERFDLLNGIAMLEGGDVSIRNESTGITLTPADLESFDWRVVMDDKKPQSDWLERVNVEANELAERKTKLRNMISGGKPEVVSDAQWRLMREQFIVMNSYHNILLERIDEAAGIDSAIRLAAKPQDVECVDSLADIDFMGAELEQLVNSLFSKTDTDKRWLSIGKTDIQTGLMALKRGIEQPKHF